MIGRTSILDIFRRGRMNRSPDDLARTLSNGHFVKDKNPIKTRYAAKPKEKWIVIDGKKGRWVTIGANGGKGGSHVFISEKGHIILGHHRLAGKSIGKGGGLFDDAQGSREHAFTRHPHVAAAVKHEGINEDDVHALADQLRSHDEEFKHDAAAMIRQAKMLVPEVRNMKNLETSDYTKIPGFDVAARSLASEYPALLGAHGYETDKNADINEDEASAKLWEYLKVGPPKPMTEQEAYEEAFNQLLTNKHDQGGGIGDEAGVSDVGDFNFGANESKEEDTPGKEDGSAQEASKSKMKSPDELAASLKSPGGSEKEESTKQKVSQSEAMHLFSSLPVDDETGYPKIVTDAVRGIVRQNPTADQDELLSQASEAVWKTAMSMGVGEQGFENKARASIKNAIASEGRSKTAAKRGGGKVGQLPTDYDPGNISKGSGSMGQAGAPVTKGKSPSPSDVQEAVASLTDEQKHIAQGIMQGKSFEEIGKELGMSNATVSRRFDEARKILGPALSYQASGSKDRYGRTGPILAEVWREILSQARQYGPNGAEFIRSVLEQMKNADSQWDAIRQGRQEFMMHGSQRHEYGPRHSPPKRIDGAVARLQALADYAGEIDDEALEDEVTGIAREFSADDLKEVARKFGVKRGIGTKAKTLESLLAKVCEGKGEE